MNSTRHHIFFIIPMQASANFKHIRNHIFFILMQAYPNFERIRNHILYTDASLFKFRTYTEPHFLYTDAMQAFMNFEHKMKLLNSGHLQNTTEVSAIWRCPLSSGFIKKGFYAFLLTMGHSIFFPYREEEAQLFMVSKTLEN